MMRSSQRPLRADAEGFLGAVAYGEPCTYQTFSDRGNDRHLARVLHGSFTEVWRELARLNSHGAGVFWTVNRTDLVARSTQNIIGLRALFTDDDGGGKRFFSRRCPPAAIVYSPGGPHCYWRLRPNQPLWQFREAQRHLSAHFRTDNKINDLPRVMRLPGFWHCKERPRLVRWVPVAPALEHDIGAVLAAYPRPSAAPHSPAASRGHAGDTSRASWRPWTRIIAEGGRNHAVNAMGYHMLREGASWADVEREVWRVNYECCRPPMPEHEVKRILNNLSQVR